MGRTTGRRLVGERYELLEEIGRGGSSTVHRALDHREGRDVAVKVIAIGGTDDALRRWRREASVVSSLRHPGLVRVLDHDEEDDAAVLVMDLLPDGSLRDHLRLGPMAPNAVATIGADVAAAIAHIHASGIVHRDVKPGNLLLRRERDGELRGALTDFGIARLLESATATTTTVVGTALYLSPEQAQGRHLGTPSDVYSLGLTLIEALTGRAAFPGTVAESLTARLLRDPAIPGGFGYGWRSLLSAMTARDPEQRPTALQVADRLQAMLADDVVADTIELRIGDAAETTPLPVRTTARRTVPRRVRVGLAAAAVAVGLTTAGSLVGAAPAFGPAPDAAAAAPTASASPSPTASATPLPTASPTSAVRTASTAARTARTTGTASRGGPGAGRGPSRPAALQGPTPVAQHPGPAAPEAKAAKAKAPKAKAPKPPKGGPRHGPAAPPAHGRGR